MLRCRSSHKKKLCNEYENDVSQIIRAKVNSISGDALAPFRIDFRRPHSVITHTQAEATMSHKRIRKFNTRETYPEQKLDNDLCQAVVANDTVYVRGQIGQDLDTRESVGIGDVTAQAEKAMSNIAMLLEESGSRLEDICKITIFLVDVRYREAVYNVVGKWLKGVFPVSTGLVVSALARPEWLVEIDVIAVIPRDRQQ
ncbi:2-iminobutanoate/2-iminopropanoate deaminase [Paraburkholderia tropica]